MGSDPQSYLAAMDTAAERAAYERGVAAGRGEATARLLMWIRTHVPAADPGEVGDPVARSISLLEALTYANRELQRLAEGSAEGIEQQVGTLAGWITEHVPGEPREPQGAIDTAIRLLGHYIEQNEELEALFTAQHKRTVEADALWRAEDPEARALTVPDLGRLIEWLIERGDNSAALAYLGDARECLAAGNMMGLSNMLVMAQAACERPNPKRVTVGSDGTSGTAGVGGAGGTSSSSRGVRPRGGAEA